LADRAAYGSTTAMVRVLIAAVMFLAIALNGPVAMAGMSQAAAVQSMAMTNSREAMDDCGMPADEEPCQMDCVLCHALIASPAMGTTLAIKFATPVSPILRQMVGLDLAPDTPPPRG
jgi:hypothetical protein